MKEKFFNMATRKNIYEIVSKDPPLLQHDVKGRCLMEFPSTGECKLLCLGNGTWVRVRLFLGLALIFKFLPTFLHYKYPSNSAFLGSHGDLGRGQHQWDLVLAP